MALAHTAGVKADTLSSFLRVNRYSTCDFDFADKLVCAMEGPLMWQMPGLREIYESVDLSGDSWVTVAA